MQNKNNIHFWFGDDSFSMQEILRSEKISVLENNGNADVCDLDFAAAESRYDMENKVKESLRGNSLFAPDKLTVIRNFWSTQRAAKRGEESLDTEAESGKLEDFLMDHLQNIVSRDAVFFLEQKSLGKKSRAFKFFEEMKKSGRAEIREFAMPIGFKFNAWLEERVKKCGGKISKANLELLAMLLGKGMEIRERGEMMASYDLYQASSEIEKLIAYCNGREIEKEDILLLVSASSDMNIFSLIESIGKRDRGRALAILSGQIREGYNENYILTMLVYHFRNLIIIKSLLDGGMSASGIAQRTKIHPMVVEKNIGYLRNLQEGQLMMIYEKLHRADAGMKTGKMEPELALDMIVAAI